VPAGVLPGSHFGPDLRHRPPIPPSAGHPAIALGTVGPTGHRYVGGPTQPYPDRAESVFPPGEIPVAAGCAGGLALCPSG
jgi:hypothetical protein